LFIAVRGWAGGGSASNCRILLSTVLGGTSATGTGTHTGTAPLLQQKAGKHTSLVTAGDASPGFCSKISMSPAMGREREQAGGDESARLVGSTAATPRYGSVGHIVDNSLPAQLQYIDLNYKVRVG
jgi:hypothetical protein